MILLRTAAELAAAMALYFALLQHPRFARLPRLRQYLIFLPLAAALFLVTELLWPTG